MYMYMRAVSTWGDTVMRISTFFSRFCLYIQMYVKYLCVYICIHMRAVSTAPDTVSFLDSAYIFRCAENMYVCIYVYIRELFPHFNRYGLARPFFFH